MSQVDLGVAVVGDVCHFRGGGRPEPLKQIDKSDPVWKYQVGTRWYRQDGSYSVSRNIVCEDIIRVTSPSTGEQVSPPVVEEEAEAKVHPLKEINRLRSVLHAVLDSCSAVGCDGHDFCENCIRIEEALGIHPVIDCTPAQPPAAPLNQNAGVGREFPNAGPNATFGKYRTGEVPQVGDVVSSHRQPITESDQDDTSNSWPDNGVIRHLPDEAGNLRLVDDPRYWAAARFDLVSRPAPVTPAAEVG
jgi:hypothetical protein